MRQASLIVNIPLGGRKSIYLMSSWQLYCLAGLVWTHFLTAAEIKNRSQPNTQTFVLNALLNCVGIETGNISLRSQKLKLQTETTFMKKLCGSSWWIHLGRSDSGKQETNNNNKKASFPQWLSPVGSSQTSGCFWKHSHTLKSSSVLATNNRQHKASSPHPNAAARLCRGKPAWAADLALAQPPWINNKAAVTRGSLVLHKSGRAVFKDIIRGGKVRFSSASFFTTLLCSKYSHQDFFI